MIHNMLVHLQIHWGYLYTSHYKIGLIFPYVILKRCEESFFIIKRVREA